jgi:glycosyltransferase involved in cell wall biosynthesis
MTSLDAAYSTTRQVTKKRPVFEKQPSDKFESVLFLPEGDGRQGEGGLRTQGFFKTSLKDKPLITVITDVFNGEQYLEETILSVINQTYDNVEYIIIDGGSTDNTLDIIKKYEHAIDYWVSEKDNGIYDAFNKAITLTLGEYYNIVGSDDVLFESAIEQVVGETLKNSDVDFVVASTFVGDTLSRGMRANLGWLGAGRMVNSHSVGMVIKTTCHHEVGLYSTKYRLCSDGLFIKKLFSSKLVAYSSNVIMGRFSLDGVSNNNLALGLCEGFMIQLETEKYKVLQIIIFIARLVKNINRLKK